MTMSRILASTSALRSLAVAGVLLAPATAQADEVNLISSDGTVDIVGDLVEFSDNIYVIRTALGELRLSAERVRCEGAACPSFDTDVADVVIAGSDTVGLGVMPLLMEGYAGYLDAEATTTSTGTEGQVITSLVGDGGFGDELGAYLVNSTGSGDAFRALIDQSAQIGMAARRIRPEEARALRDAGAGNMVDPANEHIVAIDSLVVITHPNNPVQSLSMSDLAAIYSGQITNWNQVGGEDIPITVIDRQRGSGTRSVFKNAVFGTSDIEPVDGVQVANDNGEMAAMVNSDPSAIGFVGYAFQRGAKALDLVNECGIAMKPDAFSARTEEYALQRRLYLYNRSDNLSDESRTFLDYALSPDADGVIRKAGFIDLGVASRAQPLDSDRARMLLDPNVDPYEGGIMREMLGTMVDYDRLSTTFRFRTGASRLDERGIIDMERLADYLEEAPDGTRILLVGFTDSTGPFDSNRNLSQERAERVMAELRAREGDRLAGIDMAAVGFGEIAPSACNSTDAGRAINRRVEVWIENTG